MSNLLNYVVGNNIPGCLPDEPPHQCVTWDEAKSMLIHDLKFLENYADNEAEAEAFCAAAEDANLLNAPEKDGDQVWVEVDGQVYFIMAIPGAYYGIQFGNGNWFCWSPDPEAISERFNSMSPMFIKEANVTMETLDADQVHNEYPQGEIPDALSYTVLGVTDDGDIICEWCVKNPTNPVHKGGVADGWRIDGWTHDGELDEAVSCAHCNREYGPEADDRLDA